MTGETALFQQLFNSSKKKEENGAQKLFVFGNAFLEFILETFFLLVFETQNISKSFVRILRPVMW